MQNKDTKNYTSPPKPVTLEAPEMPETQDKPRFRRAALPQVEQPIGMPGRKNKPDSGEKGLGVFKAAQRSYGAPHYDDRAVRKRIPPPSLAEPGEIPRKRRPKAIPPLRRRRVLKAPSFLQRIMKIRINPLILNLAGWGTALIVFAVIAFNFVTGLLIYNSFEVFIDGRTTGHFIPYRDELTSESFHELVINYLQMSEGGANIRVDQVVSIEPARIAQSDRNDISYVVSYLRRTIEFTIAALEIQVDGNFEAILRTQADLEHAKRLLTERFHCTNGNTVEFDIAEGWEIIERFVCPNTTEFQTPLQVHERLDRQTMQFYPYIVVSGDNLSSIAIRYSTTVTRIMQDNDLASPHLYVGQRLLLYTARPLLTSRTFDHVYRQEQIEMEIREYDNPELPAPARNIIQAGSHGQQRVIERIEFINGSERSRNYLEPEVIIEPVPHIVEVGTGPAAIERR